MSIASVYLTNFREQEKRKKHKIPVSEQTKIVLLWSAKWPVFYTQLGSTQCIAFDKEYFSLFLTLAPSSFGYCLLHTQTGLHWISWLFWFYTWHGAHPTYKMILLVTFLSLGQLSFSDLTLVAFIYITPFGIHFCLPVQF